MNRDDREYVQRLLAEADKRYEQRFVAQQEALSKADEAVQRQADAVAGVKAAVTAVAIVLLAGVLAYVGRLFSR